MGAWVKSMPKWLLLGYSPEGLAGNWESHRTRCSSNPSTVLVSPQHCRAQTPPHLCNTTHVQTEHLACTEHLWQSGELNLPSQAWALSTGPLFLSTNTRKSLSLPPRSLINITHRVGGLKQEGFEKFIITLTLENAALQGQLFKMNKRI